MSKYKILKIKLVPLFLLIYLKIYAQEYSINFNVNTKNSDTKKIVDLWQNYLRSNSKQYWDKAEVGNLQNFNVMDMEGLLNPSLMNWNFNNKILSITNLEGDNHLIKSIFDNDTGVFAITNVIAIKNGNNYSLGNYLFYTTKNWTSTEYKNIRYTYFPGYIFNESKAGEASVFYDELCRIFNLKAEKLTYFIAPHCDDIYTILGYEYIFSKGQGSECGYFEPKNNYIYSTASGGENNYHEITHYINKYFPNANWLLLTGISAYISKEKAHFNKPLIYHTNRVNEYLLAHREIDLSNPFSFSELDGETNPQYVIGAVICDLILKKGGRAALLDAITLTKTDGELIKYLQNHVLKKNENLDKVLRKRIQEISQSNKFPDNIR